MSKEVKKVTFLVEGKECVISEPDFKQISMGLSALQMGTNGDMLGGGKQIYDLCMISCDDGIKNSGKHMMSLCLKIAAEHLLPFEVEIKKN